MDHVQSMLHTGLAFMLVLAAYGSSQEPDMNTVLDHIENLASQFSARLGAQDKIIEELRKTDYTQARVIVEQEKEIKNLKERIDDMEPTMQDYAKDLSNHIKSSAKSTQVQALGCLMDTIVLTCHGGGTINVTGALYGQYADTCSECCTPDLIADCTEDIIEKNLEQFLILKLRCDNESSCEYLYEGVAVSDCEVGYVADYMLIDYDCDSETHENTPVGFTAYTTGSRQYNSGDRILFDEVLSNFGEFYDNGQSTFTCPYDGIYLFLLDLMNDYTEDVVAEIALDGTELIQIWADDAIDDYHQASGSCITMCLSGQVVEIKATATSYVFGDLRRSHFSGYMLHRY